MPLSPLDNPDLHNAFAYEATATRLDANRDPAVSLFLTMAAVDRIMRDKRSIIESRDGRHKFVLPEHFRDGLTNGHTGEKAFYDAPNPQAEPHRLRDLTALMTMAKAAEHLVRLEKAVEVLGSPEQIGKYRLSPDDAIANAQFRVFAMRMDSELMAYDMVGQLDRQPGSRDSVIIPDAAGLFLDRAIAGANNQAISAIGLDARERVIDRLDAMMQNTRFHQGELAKPLYGMPKSVYAIAANRIQDEGGVEIWRENNGYHDVTLLAPDGKQTTIARSTDPASSMLVALSCQHEQIGVKEYRGMPLYGVSEDPSSIPIQNNGLDYDLREDMIAKTLTRLKGVYPELVTDEYITAATRRDVIPSISGFAYSRDFNGIHESRTIADPEAGRMNGPPWRRGWRDELQIQEAIVAPLYETMPAAERKTYVDRLIHGYRAAETSGAYELHVDRGTLMNATRGGWGHRDPAAEFIHLMKDAIRQPEIATSATYTVRTGRIVRGREALLNLSAHFGPPQVWTSDQLLRPDAASVIESHSARGMSYKAHRPGIYDLSVNMKQIGDIHATGDIAFDQGGPIATRRTISFDKERMREMLMTMPAQQFATAMRSGLASVNASEGLSLSQIDRGSREIQATRTAALMPRRAGGMER